MILQTLNQRRHSLGRIIATIFIMTWSLWVYQACAMAITPDSFSGYSPQTDALPGGMSDRHHDTAEDTSPCCTLGMQDREQTQIPPNLNITPDEVAINFQPTENNQRVLHNSGLSLLIDQSLGYSSPPTTILFGVWRN